VRPVPKKKKKKRTKFQEALSPKSTSPKVFESEAIKSRAVYATKDAIVLNADALTGLKHIADAGIQVDTIVTSPPFYGQRDYQVDGQIGLEHDPAEFIAGLVEIFEACRPVPYWSGKVSIGARIRSRVLDASGCGHRIGVELASGRGLSNSSSFHIGSRFRCRTRVGLFETTTCG
jgi:DNA modification methylase